MEIDRVRTIVHGAVQALFAQICGGRINCESEATLQLHLAHLIAALADVHSVHSGDSFSIELEKPLKGQSKGRVDIWFKVGAEADQTRCAMELKFFKRVNQREPNNRYDVFKDILRLESMGDVSDVGFMLVATDHPHYSSQQSYSPGTSDFDFRDGATYSAGTELAYRTVGGYGPPLKLASDYAFAWTEANTTLSYLLVEVIPQPLSQR